MTSRDDEGPVSGGTAPESPDPYREALDRLLDGLDAGPGPAVEPPAGPDAARAAADVALLRRGLHLIADALAGAAPVASPADATPADTLRIHAARTDDAHAEAAATAPVGLGGGPHPAHPEVGRGGEAPALPLRGPSAVEPEDGVPGTGTAPWWRRPAPAVLAAAASLALVIGLGVGLQDLGAGGDESTTAQQAPAAAAAETDAAAPAEDPSALQTAAAERAGKSAAAAAPGQDAGTAADSGAAVADTAASAGAAAATSAGAKAAKAPRQVSGASTFNRLVACARAIVVGEVVRVAEVAGSDRVELTVSIDEYVTGSGAAERTFTVGSRSARFGDGTGRLASGQQGLFLIPGNRDVQVRAWLGDTVPTGRKEVRAAQAQRGSC